MSVCNKNHRYAQEFENLPLSQAEDGRHKCAGCAYEKGFEHGLNNQRRNYEKIVQTLPDSQAGTVRHKDASEAYAAGYADGQRKFKGSTI